MHWPGASLLILSGITLFAIIVIPSYIWHREKNEVSVSAGAIAIIAATILFFVPSSLISFDTLHDFEKMFQSTTDMGRKSLDFRFSRNNALWEEAEKGGSEDLTLLHSETQIIIDQINRIEERGDNQSDSLIAELENMIDSFSSLLIGMNGDYRGRALASALEIETYLPPMQSMADDRPYHRPEAVRQSLNLLKGAILDAEAATIRTYTDREQ